MISRKTIDEIFSTARVEEVIGDFIQLKKSGSNYKGFSPFSNEKTPSFMVSPAKQIWKDFSSGKGGSVVSFLMEHEQFTYPEALTWLAKRYNIEIEEDRERTEEEVAQFKEKENQYVLTTFAADYFKKQLHETEEGKTIGLSYFKERGFSNETIQHFDLGYSPEAWDAFTSYAMKKGYTYELLKETGLTVGNPERPVDRFRERVIFPIHSFSGRVLGFGGRILKNQTKTAKYLNSPENEIYHKSKILYGIFQAKQEILKKDECILVEGYTDVLSLYQAGIQNVVSSSGTALTPEQIRLIKRLTNNIILIYDGDSAGIKASFRGIDLILEQELNVKVIVLPDGDDPDSFAKKHSDTEIQNFIKENATDFIKFKIKILKDDAGNDPVKKAEMVSGVVESIALIPNIIQQEIYVREASALLDVREETLFRQLEIEKLSNKKKFNYKPTKEESEGKVTLQKSTESHDFGIDRFGKLEEDILQSIIKYGDKKYEFPHPTLKNKFYESTVLEEVIIQLEEDNIVFSVPFYNKIYTELKSEYLQQKNINTTALIQHPDEKISKVVSDFLFEKYELSNWERQGMVTPKKEDNLAKHIQELLLNYKRLIIITMLNQAKEEVSKELEPQERLNVLENVMRLKKTLSNLEQILGRVV